MSVDEIVEFLERESEVMESYVLLREVKVYLDIGAESYHPSIRIKIYSSNVMTEQPYHFVVSHHAHTPSQASPYYPSINCAESEIQAIRQAISTTTSFIKGAIGEGHSPQDSWLIPNEDF